MWTLCLFPVTVLVSSIVGVDGAGISPPDTRVRETKVVIVGAGVSGVAAASRLLENGINDFVILEAESRYGGRIHSVRFGGEDYVDLGGHHVHGEKGNVAFQMASPYNLLAKYETTEVFVGSYGKLVDNAAASKLHSLLEDINDSTFTDLLNYRGSVGDYITKQYATRLKGKSVNKTLAASVLDWFEKDQNEEDSADTWFDTSGRGRSIYKICEGYQEWAFKSGGYFSIFDLLMKNYPNPRNALPVKQRINYLSEVTKIKWDNLPRQYNNKVLVQLKNGISYLADHVIVTVSLGVLKERAKFMFEPQLPKAKDNSIKGLGFGTFNKVFMKFPYTWWPKNYTSFGILWPSNDPCKPGTPERKQSDCWYKQLYAFDKVDGFPRIMFGRLSGPAARYMERLSDHEVMRKTIQLLNGSVGKAFNARVPVPDLFLKTAWSSNPNFRGSYSFRSMETERSGASAEQLAEPVKNKNGKTVLLFAGEATHPYFYSTVHGAIETGWREANRTIQLLRGGRRRRNA